MHTVYIGIGSNLGEREVTIRDALELLAADPELEVEAVSSIRETDPVGVLDQPRFLNAAIRLATDLAPHPLLERLLAVEQQLGRVRTGERYGPRTIDLDLLLYGDEIVDEPGLQRPTPATRRAPLRARAARRARSRPRRPWSGADSGLARRARMIRAMSHIDELDEFEAELELRLKREYSDVFGLFRFCVLTQDATYLCNKLDLNYAPQPSYPFYHLKMEDVWVWDKNRPTRIVPKAEIYTSSDVTVEELTREGEEPKLTAEALAERIGESLRTDDDI